MLAEATKGLTQEQIAERAGLSQAAISLLLNRKRTPSYASMIALERAFPRLRELRNKEAA